MPNIIPKSEPPRGCGYRKPGGLYLVTDGVGSPCYRLPIQLTVCPCCGTGFKPARGWTWVRGDLLGGSCNNAFNNCEGCPLRFPQTKKYGLLWMGEKFYQTPEHFTREAHARGISRRISQVPHDFELGRTWILLAHRRAVVNFDDGSPVYTAGIFHAFKPARLEYVVTHNETAPELDALERRGITLVDVLPDRDRQMTIL